MVQRLKRFAWLIWIETEFHMDMDLDMDLDLDYGLGIMYYGLWIMD